MLNFTLDDSQVEVLNRWLAKHDETCPYVPEKTAIGGRITYQFSPTSIGVVEKVSCACGQEVDLTDYSQW